MRTYVVDPKLVEGLLRAYEEQDGPSERDTVTTLTACRWGTEEHGDARHTGVLGPGKLCVILEFEVKNVTPPPASKP